MLSPLAARLRSLWRSLRHRSVVESEMHEEFRLHLAMRAEDLVRAGLTPDEAVRRARLEFGSTEHYKERGRESRGLRPIDDLRVSWLDVKLGFRMLARYPGLTLVGGLAMAFAIWVGATTFEMASQVIRPTIPLPGGDRLVALRLWDAATNRVVGEALHDFVTWREQLQSIEGLGATRTIERNLVIGAASRGEPVRLAEITASAFPLTRVAPLLGRPLLATDEVPGAPPVVVIGYDLWKRRFDGDAAVIGRTVRLGSDEHTVVGVMPERYAFPVSHELWVPLHLDPLAYARRQGPSIALFGRLAAGVTLREARAELAALGERAALDFRETHEHLRPQVMPYARSVVDASGWRSVGVLSVNLPLLLLVLLVCSNVALLMYARAATRESEIAVRSALGASRGRIIMQLFAEALVLGGVAALVGLAATGAGLRWVMRVIEGEFLGGASLPFWFDDRIAPVTVLYATLLTVLGAIIAGVVPALKVTRGVGGRLKQATAGGGGVQFGGMWTAVIVLQVAATVAFPAVTFLVRRDSAQLETIDAGFPSEQYLSARLEMDREPPAGNSDTTQAAFATRFGATYRELERRLLADPAVRGVTFADRLPRMYHPHRLIEVDEGGAAPLHPQWPAYRVSAASVDVRFLDVIGATVHAGRGFHSGDLGADERTVIVNESFVRLVLGGRNPIGRRLRYVHYEEWSDTRPLEPGPWHEIVGVVDDLAMAVGADGDPDVPGSGDPKIAGIYHAVPPGGAYPAHVAVHARGNPASLAPRVRAAATETDPALRLYEIVPLDEVNRSEIEVLNFWFRLLVSMSVVSLTLSLAGIYSVMAFTVTRRTREIGIRVALGAERWRVIATILARPLTQVALGIAAGAGLVVLLAVGMTGGVPRARHLAMVLGYSACMLAVCLLACIFPTRRALGVEPTEALRSEG